MPVPPVPGDENCSPDPTSSVEVTIPPISPVPVLKMSIHNVLPWWVKGGKKEGMRQLLDTGDGDDQFIIVYKNVA